MCARPRKVTDEEVFQAAHRALTRLGPHELRLADIAAEAGVTAGALVQRFGSKHALLVTMTGLGTDWPKQFLADLQRKHASPLAALRAWGDCYAHMGETPAALMHNLAWLQYDLADPDIRRNLVRQGTVTRAAFRSLLTAAIRAGELVPETDPKRLARTIEATFSGSLMGWAFYQKGSLRDYMREDLEAVLQPYLPSPAGRRARNSS
jgi:AcrR family transcriptional regulator